MNAIKEQVVVLARTAPYFRVLTRDGAFVKAFGNDRPVRDVDASPERGCSRDQK